jgi:hypothetical protein
VVKRARREVGHLPSYSGEVKTGKATIPLSHMIQGVELN